MTLCSVEGKVAIATMDVKRYITKKYTDVAGFIKERY